MIIENAGHTHGNLFQWILADDPRVKYVAYKVTHPLFNTLEFEYATFDPAHTTLVLDEANYKVQKIVKDLRSEFKKHL